MRHSRARQELPRPSSASADKSTGGHFRYCVASQNTGRYFARMEPRGIYRERNGWSDDEHSARVKYDEHQELDVSERLYRARGYRPPFDELPWLDETANNA